MGVAGGELSCGMESCCDAPGPPYPLISSVDWGPQMTGASLPGSGSCFPRLPAGLWFSGVVAVPGSPVLAGGPLRAVLSTPRS